MLFILFLLFVVLPFVEFSLLLALADRTSLSFTLGLVILTGILGAALARWQGWRTCRRIQDELSSQHMPTDALLDAGMILVASAFLLTPGMLTDAFGFSLLIPPCRAIYRRMIKNYFQGRFQIQATAVFRQSSPAPDSRHRSDDQVIDSYVVHRDDGSGTAQRPEALGNSSHDESTRPDS